MATDVKVKFLGDSRDLTKSIDDIDKAADKTGKSLEGFGKFAKKAAIGVGAVGVGAVALGVSMFELGAKLDIMKKKAKTVFEDSLPLVQKWANESSARMGLTKNEAVELASAFGDLMKPMGFTASQAATMSTDVLNLAGALSAWSGGQKTAAEVAGSLSKAMLGEREELKSLGISITQEEVNERVATNTKKGLTFETEQQAAAIATQQLIMEKSTDAQKLWNDKQSEGQDVANNLKVKMKELQEEIAIKLYPILLNVGDWLLRVGIPRMEEIAKKVADWWAKQDGLRDGMSKAAKVLQDFIADVITLIGLIKDAVEWTQRLIDKFNSLPGADFSLMDLEKKVPGPRIPWDKSLLDILGGKAGGGPVSAGGAYVVGEHGPEVLQMGGRGGNIVPNHNLGGGVTVIVQGSVLSERDLIGVINNALRRGVLVGG